MAAKKSLELVPKGVGRPRINPYDRLLARFYEPLFLLKALGQTRGEHTPEPPSRDTSQAQRRRFLLNLSYICDFKKGGDACTAIALEDSSTCYRFWIASNKENERIVGFVREALSMLRDTEALPSSSLAHAKSQFVLYCTEFADDRIKKEGKLLRREAQRSVSTLLEQSSETAQDLLRWLEQVISLRDNILLCAFAYRHRHSLYMNELEIWASYEARSLGPEDRRPSFELVRHYMGRLAHHVRAPQALVDDARQLGSLLQSYDVRAISPPSPVHPPVCDSHTNLRGIVNRMFAQDDAERTIIEDGLIYINKTCGIFDTFMSQYQSPNLQVHAEVQLLERFYKKRLSFVDDDRFIACSKPACLCCELYFKHHPARMVVPSSHCKIWTNWSPPNVQPFTKKDPESMLQRKLLSQVTKDLREQIIRQVLERSRSSRWHPDSRTGITETYPAHAFGIRQAQGDESGEEPGEEASDEPSEDTEKELDPGLDSDDGGVLIYV